MTTLTCEQAVMATLQRAMAADERIVLLGAGVATRNPALLSAFGAERVRNTPLAEAGVVGCAAGAAAMGLRPVVQLTQSPWQVLDALINCAAVERLSGGQFEFPLVLLAPTGSGLAQALFRQVPGLRVLRPGTPADAADLFSAALCQPRPSVLFT